MRWLALVLLCGVSCGQNTGVKYSGGTISGTANPTLSAIVSSAVSPTSASVLAGGTAKVTALGNYSDGSTQDVTSQCTWTSSNLAVATIAAASNPQVVNGVAAGTANITCTIGSVSSAMVLTVTSFTITTTSIPAATVSSAYTTTLAASGGTAPYSGWTITSGAAALTAIGVTLNSSTGVLSGTPSGNGGSPYAFTVQVQDATAATTTQTLSLVVLPSSTTTGAPTYGLSTTSQLTTSTGWQPNNTAPFSGLTGVNVTAFDTSIPAQNGGTNPNCITRISDGNTLGGGILNPSQSGETNDDMISKSANFFMLVNNGAEYLFHGNPSGNCYVNDTPIASPRIRHGGFSRVTDSKIYFIGVDNTGVTAGTKLYSATLSYSGGVLTKGAGTLLFDLATCPGNPITNATLFGEFSVDYVDKYIMVAWGTNQNTNWKDVMAYNTVTNKCSHLDTVGNGTNGVVWTSDGVSHVSSVASFNIHNAGMSRDGSMIAMSGYGQAAGNTCGGTCPYAFWAPDTTNYIGQSLTNSTIGGHPAKGFAWYGSATNPNYYIRSYADTACVTPSNCKKLFVLPNGTNIIMHSNWPTPANDQSYPILVTSALNTGSLSVGGATGLSYPTTYPGPFNDSLWAIAQDGSTRWFTHFYESYNRTENFEGFNTIMSCSQDGNWCMFASDMFYGLYNGAGLGTNGGVPRTDTFMVHLN